MGVEKLSAPAVTRPRLMGHDLADAFDLANLSPAFLDDPCPTYRALQRHPPSS